MSAPGCCRHCADMCAARLGAVNAVHLGRHSQWGEEACPACDEAERIAAECDRLAKPCCERHERIHGPQSDAYEHIADFARGDA